MCIQLSFGYDCTPVVSGKDVSINLCGKKHRVPETQNAQIVFSGPPDLKMSCVQIADAIVGIIWTNAGGCIIDGKIGLWLMYKNYGLTVGFK
jgi:hypothetical protein